MSINTRLERLIDLLTKATTAGKLSWEVTTDENSFRATFPGGAVRVNQLTESEPSRPSTSIPSELSGMFIGAGKPPAYSLTVLNGNGEVVDEYRPDDPTRLGNLYSLARNSALRPDEVVDSIIGWLEAPPLPTRPSLQEAFSLESLLQQVEQKIKDNVRGRSRYNQHAKTLVLAVGGEAATVHKDFLEAVGQYLLKRDHPGPGTDPEAAKREVMSAFETFLSKSKG